MRCFAYKSRAGILFSRRAPPSAKDFFLRRERVRYDSRLVMGPCIPAEIFRARCVPPFFAFRPCGGRNPSSDEDAPRSQFCARDIAVCCHGLFFVTSRRRACRAASSQLFCHPRPQFCCSWPRREFSTFSNTTRAATRVVPTDARCKGDAGITPNWITQA